MAIGAKFSRKSPGQIFGRAKFPVTPVYIHAVHAWSKIAIYHYYIATYHSLVEHRQSKRLSFGLSMRRDTSMDCVTFVAIISILLGKL
jgi:hypothetical protein